MGTAITTSTTAAAMASKGPLPPVTEAHRRAAFTLLSWQGCSFEAAMNNPLRRRLIESCAADLRTREAQRAQRMAWRGSAYHHTTTTDVKRAAAGDMDD